MTATAASRDEAKPAHTPGPWRFEELGERGPESKRDGCGYIRCESDNLEISHHGDMGRSRAENLANAALIIRACNLVMAGKALQSAQQAKITARGDLPPDLDWGLSEGEQAAALMMNALIEQNDAMLAALNALRIWMKNHDRSEHEQKIYDELRAVIHKAEAGVT